MKKIGNFIAMCILYMFFWNGRIYRFPFSHIELFSFKEYNKPKIEKRRSMDVLLFTISIIIFILKLIF